MTRVSIPADWPTDTWYGFQRHHFTIEGCEAWLVEPKFPCPDHRWTWCTQWAEAFVPRVGTVALLEHGCYHAHVDVFKFKGSPTGMTVMRKFQEQLVSLGLAPKANLIGMSWGGFFSLRYAMTYPECVNAIYLDAPVCNAADEHPSAADRLTSIEEMYAMDREALRVSTMNPLNSAASLLGIPVLAVISEADDVVVPALNFDILEERLKTAGANIVKLSDAMLADARSTFGDAGGPKIFVY
ncbi:MAG: alpha/beta fold hydrolase, partial [Victivallales bacterium]|nr:alpha/beta fold hydrolase [Victivallales bacterium]